MIFRKRRQKINITQDLKINDVVIDQIDKTKFLGVVIDPFLSFSEHIKYVKGKISRGLGILYRGKRVLNQKTMLTLYNVFIYPYFMYCIEVWGNTCQSYLDPLIKIQKRAVRVISFAKRLDHTDPLFLNTRILKTKEIYIYSVQLFMFKFHNYKLPQVIYSLFTRNDTIHDHSTRQHNKLHVPLSKIQLTSTSVRTTGVLLYNHFYDILDMNCSYYTYKKKLKQYLLDNEITLLL